MANSSLRGYLDLLLGNHGASRIRRTRRQAAPQLDTLEGRVVLSHMGFRGRTAGPGFAGAAQFRNLAQARPVAAATTTGDTTSTSTTTSAGCQRPGGVQDAQLTTDLEKLRTDTQAVLSGSTVTDAQRQALGTSMRALRDAGATVDRTKLAAVADSVLTALADGSYDSKADALKADFAAAFTSSTTIDQALIDTAYNDFVTVARGLNVSTDELNTLAADRAAIKADFDRLGLGKPDQDGDHHGPGDSSNLELILSPGRGPGGPGRGPGGRGGPDGPGGPGRGFGRGR